VTANDRTLPLLAGTVAMVIVVTSANVLVQYPINDWLTWGAFTYPISFLVTDLCNRILGPRGARQVVYAGFVVAVVLSMALATPRIAIASGTAFLCAQVLDVLIFDRMRAAHRWWAPPLVSSSIASAVDTALFFSIAFVGTGVPWVTLGLGDYAVKLALALIMLVPFGIVIRTRLGVPVD
jgi:uncharacterized PurR-regulated membrane protein YhhQ (DUF165 family)